MAGFISVSCSGEKEKPERGSEAYQNVVSDFYVSLAAIESDEALFAAEKMQNIADQYPSEPAVWANLSVFAMRQGDFDLATQRINKALNLAPEDSDILFLAGLLESRKGNIDAALENLKQARKLDPSDLKISYALVDELERQDPQANAEQIKGILNDLLERDRGNLPLLLEVIRMAAGRNDSETLQEAVTRLRMQSQNWPADIQPQFSTLEETLKSENDTNLTYDLALLRNLLSQLPQYQHDLQQIRFPVNQIGFLITEFSWLPNAETTAAPADTGLTFNFQSQTQDAQFNLVAPIGFSNQNITGIITVNGNTATIDEELTLSFPGGAVDTSWSPERVATIDYNYDFQNDVAFAGPGGFKLYRQEMDSTFTDVTDSLGLSISILSASYQGVWANDIDLDGDLDIVLAARDGSPVVLQNNGNNRFEQRPYFSETSPVQDFIWADFDHDGDNDALFLTADGMLDFYSNKRAAGSFELQSSLNGPEKTLAVNFGDLNADGYFEIVSHHAGKISQTQFVDSTASWHTETLLSLENSTTDNTGASQLIIADLDNNAALDLLVTHSDTSQYWLSNENHRLLSKPYSVPLKVYGAADVNGDTRLDLIGLGRNNHKAIAINKGSKPYNARILQLRASSTQGDRRINSFGIGGEIESRSGLQYVRQPISQPWVHVGLGTYDEAEMLRIIWPNGSVQAEFAELGYQNNIQNEQILKGSCPWLLAYNGDEMEFATDLLWRTALGLRINAQGKAAVIHSIDWVKIDGDQLVPRQDYYDLRITADLWETHFFDHVSLMAVDSPDNTEVFVNERFTLPPPEQQLYVMKDIRPVAGAIDYRRRNVVNKITDLDGKYVDKLPLTSYQGLTDEHYIEIDVGNLGEKERQWLIAAGWIYPTDSSVNVAISQGDRQPPHGIRVEVPTRNGRWKVAKEDLGFPAGKNKTMLIRLDDLFEPGTEHRVRLYTNMEIYWDQLRVGTRVNDRNIKTTKLAADSVNLRYRGFSELVNKNRFKPTVPNYRQISGTAPRWRDLIGYYTRFGDVKELTKKVDDRYVIMNAGDELALTFPALDDTPDGWQRDFVLIGDGWVKDGDYNTGYSKTVRPLPYHGMQDYDREPGRLQDDPVYQKHTEDWADYHTRFVNPVNFGNHLSFKKH